MAQQSIIGSHKTTVSTNNGTTRVKYHNTDVVSFDQDKITLDTGGWKTVTTKTRMNQTSNQFNLGYRVYQRNFEWFVDYKDQTYKLTNGVLILNR